MQFILSKHRYHFICIIAAMILMHIPCCRLQADDKNTVYEKSAKKIISIVYDDSGSMADENDSWAQANYAMQVFASLLSEDDQMYITYMSRIGNPSDATVQVDLKNVEQSVKEIRETEQIFGGTPLEAVVVASDQLAKVQESEENAQFWLLVLTDGAMGGTSRYSDLQGFFDDYKGSEMSNHSQVHIVYLGIGSGAADIKGDDSQQLHVTKCGTDIVPALRDIANQISGRMRFEDGAITQKDSKTVTVHTDLPLYSISVLAQKSDASVQSVKGEQALVVDRNIELKYPPESGAASLAADTKKNLYGDAAVITNGSDLILPGDYTISFSQKVDLENTLIMYQPAIGMDVKISRNGAVIDKKDIMAEDTVDVEIIPVNPSTGEAIPENVLPDDIDWKIGYELDGQQVDSAEGKTLKGIKVSEGTNSFVCTMQVGDFSPQTQTISFSLEEAMDLNIEVEPSDTADFERAHMGPGTSTGTPVRFYITGNGKRLTRKEIPKKVRLDIRESSLEEGSAKGNWFLTGGLFEVTPGLKLYDDGSFELYPKNAGLLCFLAKSGLYHVTVELNDGSGIQSEGNINVSGAYKDWMYLIIFLMILFLCAYILYILFIKPKFNEQQLIVNYYTSDGRSGGIREQQLCKTEILHKFGSLSVLLPGPSSISISGLKIFADSYGGIYIKGSALKRFEKFGSPVGKPEKRFARMVKALDAVKSDVVIPDRIPITNNPLYLYKMGNLYEVYTS